MDTLEIIVAVIIAGLAVVLIAVFVLYRVLKSINNQKDVMDDYWDELRMHNKFDEN